LINMSSHDSTVSWGSALEMKSPITLTAPTGLPWVESWTLDVSPVWHVQLSGIPMIHQPNESAQRIPQWQPWPGEAVRIDVVRPEGFDGQTLTIDQSSLSISPGARSTDVTLIANMRASRGGLQVFTLPDEASVSSVSINGGGATDSAGRSHRFDSPRSRRAIGHPEVAPSQRDSRVVDDTADCAGHVDGQCRTPSADAE
jgi:hypothetical protein